MKPQLLYPLAAAVLSASLWAGTLDPGRAHFLYQGRLVSDGAAARGLYDVVFRLHDQPTPSPQGVPLAGVTNSSVEVSNGLFTTLVDFEARLFTGSPLWLEIGVRTNGSGGFQTLEPRQPIVPTPEASHAYQADQANQAALSDSAGFAWTVASNSISSVALRSGAVTTDKLANGAVSAAKLQPGAVSQLGTPDGGRANALVVSPEAWVGLGTSEPAAGLHIATGAPAVVPRVWFEARSPTPPFTNLIYPLGLAVRSNLLAVGDGSGGGVTMIDLYPPGGQPPQVRAVLLDDSGGFTNLGSVASVALSGNLLAIAAPFENAVTLVDVLDPANPILRKHLKDGASPWFYLAGAEAVALSGSLLAIGARDDQAVTLADVSNPVSPQSLAVLRQNVGGFTNLRGSFSLALAEGLLAVGSANDQAVSLVQVTRPNSPVLAATLKAGAGGMTDLLGLSAVALSSNLLIIAARDSDAVTVVNVSQPATPTVLAVLRRWDLGWTGLYQPSALALRNNWLLIGGYEGADLIDLSDPTRPRLLAELSSNRGDTTLARRLTGVAFSGTNAVCLSEIGGFAVAGLQETKTGLAIEGLVGIGTTTPQAPLHVLGNLLVEGASLVQLQSDRVALGSSHATGRGATAMGHSTASGDEATAMGNSTASGRNATALGAGCVAEGDYAVAMGNGCHATNQALAAGRYAMAIHPGSFVWADASSWDWFSSTGSNQFLIRAAGGVGIGVATPATALEVAGDVTAHNFRGSGYYLTGVNATRIDGLDSDQLWKLGGNAGSDSRTNFLGTADNEPLEIRVNNSRVVRLEPATGQSPNVLLGSPSNAVAAALLGATVGGGGGRTEPQVLEASHSTISGGQGNRIRVGSTNATIAGGMWNTIFTNSPKAAIGGGEANRIRNDSPGAVIGGGHGNSVETNAGYSVIGGGVYNSISASSDSATIAGGDRNSVGRASPLATIGGGFTNVIGTNASAATIAGGAGNRILDSASSAAVGGGFSNTNGGSYAVVPGGFRNQAAGDYSFAAGAMAKAVHEGAFVWADATGLSCLSDYDNQFKVRAAGGVRVVAQASGLYPAACRIESTTANGVGLYVTQTSSDANVVLANPGSGDQLKAYSGPANANLVFKVDNDGDVTGKSFNPTSDRNAKENFAAVDPQAVLARVLALPISRWNFKADETQHIGPMAQDFHAAFAVGPDDKHIATVDADGVALAAIQGLNQKLEAQATRLQAKEAELEALRTELMELRSLLRQALTPPHP